MSKIHGASAFRYQLRDYLLGFLPFYLVMVVIVAASLIVSRLTDANISFTGYGVAAAICLFIFGIVSPRPAVRLCIQLGVSRRTAFLTQLAAVALSAALLAAAGEALLAVAQAFLQPDSGFFLADLYQLLYEEEGALTVSLGAHLRSGIFNLALMLCTYAAGMFLTFLFWRLNRVWTIVAAVSIPLILNGVPALCYWLAMNFANAQFFFAAVTAWLAAGVGNVLVFFLLCAALLTAIAWLLLRRANIKAPQGS